MQAEILYEPRLTQVNDDEKTYLIQRGGQSVQYYPFTAQSFSNSSITWKADPPTFDTIVDRNAIVAIPVSFDITGDSGSDTEPLWKTGEVALRAFPFSSCVSSLTVNINGQSITTQLSDIVHVLSRYGSTADSRTRFQGVFPSALDQYQVYQDSTVQNSPLGGYANSIPQVFMPRGAWPLTFSQSSRTRAVFTTVIYEYVNISPFYQRQEEGIGGLANIRNLTFQYTLSNLARMVSGTIPGLADLQVNILGQPTMYMGFVSPPEGFSIPRSINYAYRDMSYYSTRFGALNSGASSSLVSNVVQFGQLPERVYICARKAYTSVALDQPSYTDTYLKIDKININFNNVDGIQSSTRPHDLYLQSVRNGCNMSWIEFDGLSQVNTTGPLIDQFGTVGGVLCFEFGKDIPLRGYDAVGMSKSWNFQVTLDVTNTSGQNFSNVDLVLVAQYDGILTLEAPGQAKLTLGFITPSDVQNAAISEQSYERVQRLFGGSAFGSIVKFLKPFGKKAVQKACDTAMSQMGSGMQAGMLAGQLKGGAVVPPQTLKSRAMR